MSSSFDEFRFIEALTRHQPALEAFCHANLGDRAAVREVLQGVCVKLWQKAAEWNPETEFLPWAFTVARFTLMSHLRDRMRDRLVFDEDVVLAMAAETERAAGEFDERREALGECMEMLRREQRELLHEHYIAGCSVREIAEGTGRTESAVKMTLLRLRQQLGGCIERRLRASL